MLKVVLKLWNSGDNLKLWQNVKGYVCISVKGFSKERFLNLLAANDIYVWDIGYFGNTIKLSLTVSGFRRIRPLLKKTHCRIKILSKHGFPFIIEKYKNRYLFNLGFCLFWVSVFALSQFIWLLEINGNSTISDAEILAFCKSRNICAGTYKHAVDIEKLKTDIRKKYPQISWISVVQRGTKLSVNIAENVPDVSVPSDAEPCDIISVKDCVITEIIAQNGTPVVNVGEAVKKGDILIRSDFDMLDENGTPAPLYPAHSAGKVRGKWSEELSFDFPYLADIKIYTGETHVLRKISIFGIEFDTNFLKKDTKFKKYDIINKNTQLNLGVDYPLPVIIKKTIFKEYEMTEKLYSKEEAEKAASLAADRKLMSTLPQNCDILDKQIEFIHSGDHVKVMIKLLLEDDIGVITGGNVFNGTNEAAN